MAEPSAPDPRSEVVEALAGTWMVGDDSEHAVAMAYAQVQATIYVGDQIAALREALDGLNVPRLQNLAEDALMGVSQAADQIGSRHG